MVEGEDKGADGLDKGPSLDPRAMFRSPGVAARIEAPSGERPAAGPQKPADETLSLDPATWASAKPTVSSRPVEPEFVKEASAAPKPSRRLIWMLGGGVVLAAGVGAGALAI
ncbi:MAG: hypothetical protein P4L64_08640, partial [Caulobacteraceae bacterium]|nr:hypothetical protein [Caulobacteraceae bacterium]